MRLPSTQIHGQMCLTAMDTECSECGGDGTELIGDGTHGGTEQQACSACTGTGKVTRVVCSGCLDINQAAVGMCVMIWCHGCKVRRWCRRYEPRCEAVHPDRDLRCGLWEGHTEFEDHCRVLNRSGLLQDSTLTTSGPLDRVTWDARTHPLDRVLGGGL